MQTRKRKNAESAIATDKQQCNNGDFELDQIHSVACAPLWGAVCKKLYRTYFAWKIAALCAFCACAVWGNWGIFLLAQHLGGAKLRPGCYAIFAKENMPGDANSYDLQNVACQPCYPFAKSHQDHLGSQSEQLRGLVTFQGGASLSSNLRPHVVQLTAASPCFQVARVANFSFSFPFYSCITMGSGSSDHSALISGLRPPGQLPPGQLPPRRTATYDIRHTGQLPPRTTATRTTSA